MKKGYIIQEIGYEYNDEYYYKSECGGGTPKMVFTDEILAKKKMLELEINEWKGKCLCDYGEDFEGMAEDDEEFSRILEELGIDDLWRDSVPADASDDLIKKLIKHADIRFYEIIEVDVDENNLEEINTPINLLDIQDVPDLKKKGGIFDSVDNYISRDIQPIVVEQNDEVFSKEALKEVIKETEDDFLTIKEQMKKLRDEARSKVKNFFIKGMNKVFEMYPEVKSVSWRQYTPYFNDGEECTFSANVSYFGVNGFDDYNDEGEDGAINVIDYDYANGGRQYKYHKGEEIYEAIKSFLKQLENDDYKTMFGDHVLVIVRKDEITIEEYDHD